MTTNLEDKKANELGVNEEGSNENTQVKKEEDSSEDSRGLSKEEFNKYSQLLKEQEEEKNESRENPHTTELHSLQKFGFFDDESEPETTESNKENNENREKNDQKEDLTPVEVNLKTSNNNFIDQYLLCKYEKLFYGIPLTHVYEVVESLEEYKLPLPRPGITGLITVRDSIYGMIDPHEVFTICSEKKESKRNECIIICKSSEKHYGLRVDQVLEVINIQKDQLNDIPNLYDEETPKAAKHLSLINGKTITFLDLDKVVSA